MVSLALGEWNWLCSHRLNFANLRFPCEYILSILLLFTLTAAHAYFDYFIYIVHVSRRTIFQVLDINKLSGNHEFKGLYGNRKLQQLFLFSCISFFFFSTFFSVSFFFFQSKNSWINWKTVWPVQFRIPSFKRAFPDTLWVFLFYVILYNNINHQTFLSFEFKCSFYNSPTRCPITTNVDSMR